MTKLVCNEGKLGFTTKVRILYRFIHKYFAAMHGLRIRKGDTLSISHKVEFE